jgi:ubiquinone/menaquinone biosynthesis C-methylase UbiE
MENNLVKSNSLYINKFIIMNVFKDYQIAQKYDSYYQSVQGGSVDSIERLLIQNYLKQIFSCEMLELGCGTGHWTRFFCEEGFPVTGIDESEFMLEQARAKMIPQAQYLKADATSLPFSDHSFSVISSVTMFEFVENIHTVLDEIDRILKPGGYLLTGWLNALSEVGLKKENSKTFKNAHFYTPEEIGQFMLRFGTPKLNYGVYYSSGFELLDGTKNQDSVQPAFIASLVQKKIINFL